MAEIGSKTVDVVSWFTNTQQPALVPCEHNDIDNNPTVGLYSYHPVSTEGVVMARLNAETAEAPAPDAAADASGPGRGHPEGSGRWPVAALRGVTAGGASRTSSEPPAAAHQWGITRSVLQGWCGASLKTSRAGRRRDRRTCGFMLPECLDAARFRGPWVRRGAICASRPPVSRAPSDFLSSRLVTDCLETNGEPRRRKQSNRGAAQRWLFGMASRPWLQLTPPSS